MNTTQGSFYVITELTRDKLEFQFYPPSIDVTRRINLAELTIIGKNFPLYQYMSGASEIAFDIDFVSDAENRKDVLTKCRWLESLAANNGNSSIERVYIVFGEVFKRRKWIIKSFNYSLSLYDKVYGNLPRQATGKIVFALAPDNDLSKNQIRLV